MTTLARRFFKLCCVFMASSFLIAAVPPPVQADKLEEGRAAIGEGDYARAVELLAPLADSGDAVAQNAMGVLFVQGWGVDRDPKRAVSYFQRSAKQANAKGAMNLADAYRTGTGVKPSCVKARDLLAQHAQNGMPRRTTTSNQRTMVKM